MFELHVPILIIWITNIIITNVFSNIYIYHVAIHSNHSIYILIILIISREEKLTVPGLRLPESFGVLEILPLAPYLGSKENIFSPP